MTVFRCGAAVLPGGISGPVDISCDGGVITSIGPAGSGPLAMKATDEVLPGLVMPGFADAHSHAFHRGLRGRTHGGPAGRRGEHVSGEREARSRGSFWTWRDAMYALSDRLDPDTLHELALATYVEMVCAGYTAVGEFHYLHHAPGGRRYAEPNAMGLALAAAAELAGIGLTLLDVVYLAGGFDIPVSPAQQRFSDGTAENWANRVAELPAELRVGVAIHSVRAVPVRDLAAVAQAAGPRVLHVHLSEQPAENEAALAATGRTPTQLLSDAGALTDRTAAVHATHLTPGDIDLLGAARCAVVICPTTEADLADGLPAAGALAAAGARMTLGGDQHVIVDPFAQARGLEYGERLVTGVRGTFQPADLVLAATLGSHRAIGSRGGQLSVGAPADFVAVRTDSARTAGADPAQLVMCASAADVAVVVIGGRVRARDGVHETWGEPGVLLARVIEGAWAK